MTDRNKGLFEETPSQKHDENVIGQARRELAKIKQDQPAGIRAFYFQFLAAGATLVLAAVASRKLFDSEPSQELTLANDFETLETLTVAATELESLEEEDDFELIENLEELEQWEDV
jgi:hypothetical protein